MSNNLSGILVEGAEFYMDKAFIFNEIIDNLITLLDMCQGEGLGGDYNYFENLLNIYGEFYNADVDKEIMDILQVLDDESKLRQFQRLEALRKNKPHQDNLKALQEILVPMKYR